ncbi:isoprenoid synthase domain-containing protein [Aspergillus californicus]
MNFKYSTPVEAKTVGKSGCATTLDVRIHKNNDLADKTSEQFFLEWKDVSGSQICDGSHPYNYSPVGNFAALAYPECEPGRLALVTVICDLIFAQDDLFEYGTSPEPDKVTPGNASRQSTDKGKFGTKRSFFDFLGRPGLQTSSGHAQLVARILLQWEDMDKYSFDFAMAPTAEEVDIFASNPLDIMTLPKYIELRQLHAGGRLYAALTMLASGIHPSEAELKTIEDLVRPLGVLAILANDYYSYRKERNLHRARGWDGHSFNAVSVTMVEHGMSEDDAMRRVRGLMKLAETAHCVLWEERRRAGFISEDIEAYATHARLYAAGVYFWTATAPRYAEDNEILLSSKVGLTAPVNNDTSKPGSTIASAPLEYIMSSPSKRVRETFIHALDAWYNVPSSTLKIIADIIGILHAATLDDVEDESPLRRQMASTHAIFGKAQTINSATYAVLNAFKLAEGLDPRCISIIIDECENLTLGQSMDLNWRYCKRCPTVEEYKTMVDLSECVRITSLHMAIDCPETGSLFRTLSEIPELATMFGTYFQIRDDLKNLESDEYTAQKGFCEDFDEGKFSFPIVHSLSQAKEGIEANGYDTVANTIMGILHNPPLTGLSVQQKMYVLDYLRNGTSSLEYTAEFLRQSELEIRELLANVEGKTGTENYLVRLLLRKMTG